LGVFLRRHAQQVSAVLPPGSDVNVVENVTLSAARRLAQGRQPNLWGHSNRPVKATHSALGGREKEIKICYALKPKPQASGLV
jgi:hypothetical protein